MRRTKKKHEWTTHATFSKWSKSAKVEDLKTNTKYEFRVQAINNKQAGTWSNTIEAETRYGAFGRTVGTAGAFFGGTAGAPVIGAVGFDALAAISAEEKVDRTTAKTAAGVGAGIGAGVGGAVVGFITAPFVGGATALAVNQEMSGKLDTTSPQTSDDEN
jgi:hypothetical protein